ncbi:hypothetical protein UPYG_G00308750 [Umbra pygmaea]|uniref:Ig-like domain-containing protein n=1 Tax=Umbra pygmaea TaxID=75934 RepID=A0ABD0VZ12_UMBPY
MAVLAKRCTIESLKVQRTQRTVAQTYGGLGGEITMTTNINGLPDDILWKHNTNKVVEFDGTENVEYGSYKGRTVLDWHTGALTIKDLTEEDSGPYVLETTINGNLQYSYYKVEVMNAVAQPSVTCEINHNGTTLLCSADLQPLTQFTWRSPDGPERPGSELFIPESENQPSVYTCVVRNPVSEETAEFNLKDCHTEKSSPGPLEVILLILLIILLCIGGVLIYCFYRWKKRKSNQEILREVPESQDLVNTPFLYSSSDTPPEDTCIQIPTMDEQHQTAVDVDLPSKGIVQTNTKQENISDPKAEGTKENMHLSTQTQEPRHDSNRARPGLPLWPTVLLVIPAIVLQ